MTIGNALVKNYICAYQENFFAGGGGEELFLFRGGGGVRGVRDIFGKFTK